MLAGTPTHIQSAADELLQVAEDLTELNARIRKHSNSNHLHYIAVVVLNASTKDEQHQEKVRLVFRAMLAASWIQKDWPHIPKVLATVGDRRLIVDYMSNVGFSELTISQLNPLLEWAAKTGELNVVRKIIKNHKKEPENFNSREFIIAKGYYLTNAFFLAIDHEHPLVLRTLCKRWELWYQDKSMLLSAFFAAVVTGKENMVAPFLEFISLNNAARVNAATRAYQEGHFALARFIFKQSNLSQDLLLEWIVNNTKELFSLSGLFASLKLEEAGVQNADLSVEETRDLAKGNLDEAAQYFLSQFQQTREKLGKAEVGEPEKVVNANPSLDL